MTEPSPRPLTRRELRLAEREASLAAPSPRHLTTPSPVTAPAGRAETAARREEGSTGVPGPGASPTPGPLPRRRDLREADRAVDCPAPFAVVRPTTAGAATAPTAGTRRTRRLGTSPAAAAKGLVTVALAGALVTSGLSYVEASPFSSPGYATAAQIKAAERAAEIKAQAAAERSARASTTRLTAQANAYAAAKRVEALAQAEQALLTASTTSDGAEPVLGPDGLAALETAVAELSTLVAQAPAPEVTSPVEGLDAEDRVATSRAGSALTTAPTDPSASTAPTAEDASSADEAGDEAPAADVAADRAAVQPTERPADRATETPAARVPEPEPAEVDAPGSSTAELLTLDAEALDLTVTTQLVAAAAQVDALAQEVSKTAEETLAAQEAARIAAEKAAAERARKIAVAKDSANGAIPSDVLCAVDFDADAQLRCDAAEALEKLNRAYREAFGHDLRITSTYRSYAAQVSTKAARGYLAAAPGTSNHGLAVAVDFGGFGAVGQFSSPSYRWMKEHAGEYGWVHPRIMEPGGGGPQEPWHWEYGTE